MKSLIVLVAAAAIGYYAYQALTGGGEPESCNAAFNHCMKTCRRTATEAPAAQACQDACKRDLASCQGK
jgi:hypothetical protein